MSSPTPMRDERLARAMRPVEDAMRLHALYRGKMQTLPKCPVRGFEDFALWYTPGVAAPSCAIAADPEAAWVHTSKADTIAIVTESNADGVVGGVREALRGADVCIAFSTSGPGVIEPAWVRAMARDAIVFACANPVPEIWPWQALESGARIVATGRSDFPNQLNNALVFPGLFRGVLDVRARTISAEMASAVAGELARFAEARGIREDSILPRMDEWDLHPRVATVTAMAAQAQGLARVSRTAEDVASCARRLMQGARDATATLMEAGLIAGA